MPPFLPGALFVAVGLPLVASQVPPNRFYGFRTAATLADRALWYRVNRAMGIDLVAGGLVLIAAGYLLPPPSLAGTALFLLLAVAVVAHGAYLARRAGGRSAGVRPFPPSDPR